jgi:hypothetical protein
MKWIKFTLMVGLTTLVGLALPPGAGAIQINEIRIDNPASDTDEYFELVGNPNESLDGLTYIVIGDGAAGSGAIESVTDLTGMNLEDDGFLSVHKEGTTGTCAVYDEEESLNFENSDNVTHLLVAGFTGSSGDDLDTDDDGVLDVEPWTAIEDCVALIEDLAAGEHVYCATQVGPDGIYVPGHIVMCAFWVIGDFETCTHDTPGEANDTACSVPNAVQTWGTIKSMYK